MSPITHFLTGWALANSVALRRRERLLVTLAAVVPDVDGLGIVPELLTRNTSHPVLWFSQFHHHMHNLLFAFIVGVLACALATSRWKTGLLALLAFHVHLAEDVLGSRGTDGLWSVPYLWPFSRAQWVWGGQWALNGWQNFIITIVLLLFALYVARKRSCSPIEIVSQRGDAAFVRAVHARFSRAKAMVARE